MCASDARAWTHNQPVWLNVHGDVARAVTREEQKALGKALERNAKVQQSFRQVVPLLPLKTNHHRRSQQRPAEIEKVEFAFEVTWHGDKRVVTVFRGDLRYATGREVLSARLLADHGECILHGRNGKCMAVLRDPLLTERPANQGRRMQFSRNPADELKTVPAQNVLRRSGPTEHRSTPVRLRERSYAPDKCPNDCRGTKSGKGWAVPKSAPDLLPNEHHPFCMHAKAWKKSFVAEPAKTHVLYDVMSATIVRDAYETEIEEARRNAAKTLVPQVTVQDHIYTVLERADAERAAAEARGETVAALPPRSGDEDAEETELAALGPEVAEEEETDEHELDTTPPPPLPPLSARSRSSAVHDAEQGDHPDASTPSERADWPMLESRSPESYRQNADITARTYLTRKPPAELPALPHE